MSITEVFMVDLRGAAPVGGFRLNDKIVVHSGLTVEEQAEILGDLLDPDDRPVFAQAPPSLLRLAAG